MRRGRRRSGTRSRRRRLGGRRRAGARRSRVGRVRTKVVNYVFDSESVLVTLLLAGATAFTGNGTGGATLYSYTSQLPAFSGGQAPNFCFVSNLYTCSQVCPNYQTFSNLYDWFKLRKVVYTFTVPIDPKRDMTVGLGTSTTTYNFQGALTYDPDMTLVDYDGIQLPTAAPTNGDCTQIIYNRTGVRKHRAFSTIRRTFYPRLLSVHPQTGSVNGIQSQSPAYPNIATTGPASTLLINVTSTYRKGPRYGWQRSQFDNSFTGALALFTSYKGPNANLAAGGEQPQYSWSIQSRWYVSMRDTIYG